MIFNKRMNQLELLDDLSLHNDALYKNLDELEWLNRWVGSKKVLLEALNQVHAKYLDYFNHHPVVIGDLGCGSGDILRAVSQWAAIKNVKVELIGIDANPHVVEYAIKKSPDYPNIQYKTINILAAEFSQINFDIVCMNSVCHHFDDNTLALLFKTLVRQTRVAIIINDLHRHWMSYYGIKSLAWMMNSSSMTKADGALSVRRAFRKSELTELLKQANITSYQMGWRWIFRWKVIIFCFKGCT